MKATINENLAMNEKFVGAFIGCGIGDTLGMAVEGWKYEQIKKYVGKITEPIDPVIARDSKGNELKEDEFGKLKYWTRNLKKGQITDDTILTLAVGEAIVRAKGFNLQYVAENHLAIIDEEKRRYGGTISAFGGTTMKGLSNLAKGISPEESGVIGAPGNAPPMKMSSVGLYMALSGKYDEGLVFAEQVGRMTHLDPRSVAAGVVQAHAIYSLAKENFGREVFVNSLEEVCARWERPLTNEYSAHEKGNLISRLEWIRKNYNVEDNEACRALGSSSLVLESYPFALFMFQKYWNSPLKGLIETVNYGGDCDTTGAMYGALAGARNGIFIPSEWIDMLQDKERIFSVAEKLGELK